MGIQPHKRSGFLFIRFVMSMMMAVWAGCNQAADNSTGNTEQNINDNTSEDEFQPVETPVEIRVSRVELPENSTVSLEELSAITAFGRVDISSDGSFEHDAFGDLPQLAIVDSPNGEPMMMGWSTERSPTVNARSTAEVLMYFAFRFFMLPDDVQADALATLQEEPLLDTLAQAIADSLAEDPDSMSRENPEVTAAVIEVYEAILAKYDLQATRQADRVQVEPSERQSGVWVNQVSGVNTIQVVNDYRRRGYVFVEKQAYVPEGSDTEVPEVERYAEFWLPADRRYRRWCPRYGQRYGRMGLWR